MKEPKVLVTMKDVQRYRILQDVLAKRLKATEASQILDLSYIHLLRLKKKLKEQGFRGLLRRGRDAPNKLPKELINQVISLRKKYYYDFNIMHLKDKLKEAHKIARERFGFSSKGYWYILTEYLTYCARYTHMKAQTQYMEKQIELRNYKQWQTFSWKEFQEFQVFELTRPALLQESRGLSL